MEGGPDQTVLLREVEIEPNVKVDCVSKVCFLGHALSASGGVLARARV